MAEENKRSREVEFFFEFDKNYRIVATNGAWGGITPRGDIHVDFFVERQGIPESVKQTISEEGALGGITETKPGKRLVRTLQVGVLITVEEAQNLVKFLTDRIKQIEEIKSKV